MGASRALCGVLSPDNALSHMNTRKSDAAGICGWCCDDTTVRAPAVMAREQFKEKALTKNRDFYFLLGGQGRPTWGSPIGSKGEKGVQVKG